MSPADLAGGNRKRSAQERLSRKERRLLLLVTPDELADVLVHTNSEVTKRELVGQWIRYSDLPGSDASGFLNKDLLLRVEQDGQISVKIGRHLSWNQRIASLLRLLAALGWTVLWFRGPAASGLTALAGFLAGRKRAASYDEWRSHLVGMSGHEPPDWRTVKAATGFVRSAIRFRCSDVADAGWRLAEAVLKSRKLSNVTVFVPTGVAAIIILHRDGAAKTLAVYGSIAAIGGSLYALIRVGRWYRNVTPPEPKARRAGE